jgi:Flp pilus assembly protein CpaB
MNVPSRRRPGSSPGFFAAPLIALAVVASAVVIVAALWALGLLDLSRFRSGEPSTAGLVAIPTPGRPIPAYTRVTRDHLWDARRNRLAVVYLPPRAVTREMLVSLSSVIGRVLGHEKAPGYVFTDDDFLPRGTREGIVAGIPAGKRAIRVPSDKVEGVFGLHDGDRFDLVATMPIDASRTSQSFNVSGVYSEQLSVQARLSNWQKQATVRVLVQNGVIVESMTTRQVPILQSSLTEHASGVRMRPVQEAVIAIDPEEVARLTEAMAVDAKISMIPRSGRPDDPIDSRTPDLRPVSPFTTPGAGALPAAHTDEARDDDSPAFSVVETIMGRKRALTAVPRQ